MAKKFAGIRTKKQEEKKQGNRDREEEKQCRAKLFRGSDFENSSRTRSKAKRKARREEALNFFNLARIAHEADPKKNPMPKWPFKGPPPISYVTYFDGPVKRKGGENYYGPAKKVVLAASVYANGSYRHFDLSSKAFV